MNVLPLAETDRLSLQLAPPRCDGSGDCDGSSLVRLGASFTSGDLALLSLSIPADQWKRTSGDRHEAKPVRVWYVVVAADGAGDGRVLTGILTGEARQALSRRIETDSIEQMEPIKFTPRNVCGGILHRKAIKQRRIRLNARKRKPRE